MILSPKPLLLLLSALFAFFPAPSSGIAFFTQREGLSINGMA